MTSRSILLPCLVAGGLAMTAGCKRHGTPPAAGGFPVHLLGRFYEAGGYWEMDQDAEAARRFETLLADGGDDPAVHANLAACYLGMQDMDRAAASIRQAVSGAPGHPDIQLIHAAVLQARADHRGAQEVLGRLVAAHPDHVAARYAWITALSNDDPDAHRARLTVEYDELLRRVPHNLAALLAAALVEAEGGALDRALERYQRALAIIATPPDAIASAVAQVPDAVRGGRQPEVVRTIILTRNLMRQSDRFRADILELGAAGGGVRALVAHPVRPASGPPSAAIAATMRFEDHTAVWLKDADAVDDVVIGAVTPDRRPAVVLLGTGRAPRLYAWDVAGLTDRTAQAGLVGVAPSRAALFVDLDNDRQFDLVFMTAEGPRVFRATGPMAFEDATIPSGVAGARLWLGAEPVDFDHDGDLDLIAWNDAAWTMWRNDGEGRLERVALPGLPEVAGILAVVAIDLDDDGDVDLAATVRGDAGARLRCFSNQRLARFDEVTVPEFVATGAVAGPPLFEDLDGDGWFEIIDVGTPRCTSVGLDFAVRGGPDIGPAAASGAPADFDNDGDLDIVRVATDGTTSAPGIAVPPGTTLHAVDLDVDGRVDVLASNGQVFRNVSDGTGAWLRVGLTALITGDSRFNAFGLGSTVEIRAGRHYQKRTVRGPTTHFGLGPARHADVLRVVWPNGNYQNLEFRASDHMGLAADQTVIEEQSLKGSCPYLYAWDGARYRFVTDVLWRSALGMSIASGVTGHHGTADDYFKIPTGLLAPRDGQYILQFTEELWETSYFDYTRLLVVDHPGDGDVVVDERCLWPPYPPFEIHRVLEPHALASAVDHRGRDLRPLLAARDQQYVSGYAPTRYQGLVEDTTLTLDLGPFESDQAVKLYLHGWLMPTDASTNVAVSQNPTVTARPPLLEVVDAAGAWVPLDLAVGFPSGKNKTMVLDLSGRWPTADHRVRLSTNFAIHWDHVFFTVGPQDLELRVTELPVVAADLHVRGYSHEYHAVPGGPVVPDYDALDPRRQWRDLVGDYTRCGDVTELLTAVDDRYAIVGAGDEVTLRFDATALPALPEGWVRDVIIHTDGWLKDGDLNSATGKTVDPLPFRAMTSYPYGARERDPQQPEDIAFQRRYNSRRRDQHAFREWLRRRD